MLQGFYPADDTGRIKIMTSRAATMKKDPATTPAFVHGNDIIDRLATGVSASIEAQRARLLQMLADGPERRMTRDRDLGWGLQRADMWQAHSYRCQLKALDKLESGTSSK
jgi:hypothetical protein